LANTDQVMFEVVSQKYILNGLQHVIFILVYEFVLELTSSP